MLLALNLPLIRLWVKVIKTPEVILFPAILLLTMVGDVGGEEQCL